MFRHRLALVRLITQAAPVNGVPMGRLSMRRHSARARLRSPNCGPRRPAISRRKSASLRRTTQLDAGPSSRRDARPTIGRSGICSSRLCHFDTDDPRKVANLTTTPGARYQPGHRMRKGVMRNGLRSCGCRRWRRPRSPRVHSRGSSTRRPSRKVSARLLFSLICSQRLCVLSTQRNPTWLVEVSIGCGWRAAGR
jgi:hypothetical protein